MKHVLVSLASPFYDLALHLHFNYCMCMEHYLTVLAALLLLLYKQVVDVNPHRLVECSTVKINYSYE